MGRKQYKVGDRVLWQQGEDLRVGHIVRVAVSPGYTRQRGRFEATKKDPAFIVADDETGERSVHHRDDFLQA